MVKLPSKFTLFLDLIRKKYLIWVIFLIVLEIRLFYAFQTTEFSDDNAYSVLNTITDISTENTNIFSHHFSIFNYILYFFSLFVPLNIVAKILPNIFASLIIFVVFKLSIKITRDVNSSLFASFLSGFVPVFFIETINSISVYSLVIPLVLYSFYSFLMISSNSKYVYNFLVSIAILSFTSPAVFIVFFGLIIYSIIMRIEKMDVKNAETEAVIVSGFLILWSQFLLYKNAFLMHGFGVIWQNIPSQILLTYFTKSNILSSLYLIGIIPAFFGVHTLYLYVMERKSKYMYFFLSYVFPVFFFLWLRLINPITGLLFISTILIVISSIYFKNFMIYLSKSKFSKFKIIFVLLLVFGFGITTFIPLFSSSLDKIHLAPTNEHVDALKYLGSISTVDSKILSPIQISNFVEYYTGRKTLINNNFIDVNLADSLYSDYLKMYSTFSLTESLRLFDKYGVSYLITGTALEKNVGIVEPGYIDYKSCFIPVKSSRHMIIYQIVCGIDTSS